MPISLVITVELVKTIQAFFIYQVRRSFLYPDLVLTRTSLQDIDMYYEPVRSTPFEFRLDSDFSLLQLDHPCLPKTWNISDDLGQIEYIFSDKTGTLTQNVMEFQKCAVGGVAYGEGITEAMLGVSHRSLAYECD